MKKCCGTCRFWNRKGNPPSCLWPEPRLPFWAHINNGDHGNYTTAEQGTLCRTWEEETKGWPAVSGPAEQAIRRGEES